MLNDYSMKTITFDNGWTVSIRAGREVAAWDKDGNRHNFGWDTVEFMEPRQRDAFILQVEEGRGLNPEIN